MKLLMGGIDMNIQDLQVKIYQLKQFCEQTKEQLLMGEKNLQDLSKIIIYQTGPSRTGQEAAQISNRAARQLRETVQSILTLEMELNAYIKQITS